LALAKVALMGGRLVVTVPVGSAAAVRKAVVTWYRLHAAVRLPERDAIMAKKMGVPVLLVLIRDQRHRWGRCDPNRDIVLTRVADSIFGAQPTGYIKADADDGKALSMVNVGAGLLKSASD